MYVCKMYIVSKKNYNCYSVVWNTGFALNSHIFFAFSRDKFPSIPPLLILHVTEKVRE